VRNLGLAGAFALLAATSVHSQHKQVPTNPGSPCGERSSGLPDDYYDAVLGHIEPPPWKHSLIKISVGTVTKVALLTDGYTFKLWTETVTPQDIGEFLLKLDRSCRLPADPADAAALIKIKWESADLSAAEFAQLHQNLTNALSRYAASAQEKYSSMIATKLGVVYFETLLFRVVYDDDYQQINASVWNDPKQEQNRLMLEWIYALQKLAEDHFHHRIWKEIWEH
jgi:hypothetical protein